MIRRGAARNVVSGFSRTVSGRNEKAPLCRVGRSNEPAKAGGAAVIGRASGFLEAEACTTRNLAAHLGLTLAQTSLRKPSRAKQELRESYRAIRGRSTARGTLFPDHSRPLRLHPTAQACASGTPRLSRPRLARRLF